ncbi:MAG: hypothetical protein LRS48_04410 [Desulfurococcales archaeon]|nr:hypothetical protein [Desulfurococcales archaeon]
MEDTRLASRFVGREVGREIEEAAVQLLLELKEREENGSLGSWARASWLVRFCPSEEIRREASEVWLKRARDAIREKEAVEKLDELLAECAELLGDGLEQELNNLSWLG